MTPLPGIGTRQDFVARAGRRIGVITYRDGHTELIVSRVDDPDTCTASIPLSVEEASALANLLGAPQLVADLRKEIEGLDGVHTKQLPLAHGSPYDGRTLGDTQLRTRTAVSVVAVVRAGTVHPSPRPDFVLGGGDALITIGTSEGLAKAADVLDRG